MSFILALVVLDSGLILNKNSCPPYPKCAPMACALDVMGNKLGVDTAKVNTIKAKAVVEQDEMEA